MFACYEENLKEEKRYLSRQISMFDFILMVRGLGHRHVCCCTLKVMAQMSLMYSKKQGFLLKLSVRVILFFCRFLNIYIYIYVIIIGQNGLSGNTHPILTLLDNHCQCRNRIGRNLWGLMY